MIRRRNGFGLAIGLVVLLSACNDASRSSASGPDTPPGSPATLRIETDGGPVEVLVEVADTPEERQRGLMGVAELEEDRGMVFIPDAAPDRQRFWMKDTLIPLSVAWWDQQGRIVAIQDMEPCAAEPCDVYDPGVDSVGAVEVNQGFFDDRGVEVGNTVRLQPG